MAMLRASVLLLASFLCVASGFSVAAPARPAACRSAAAPAVRMGVVLRTNDIVKVISGDDKVRAMLSSAPLSAVPRADWPLPLRIFLADPTLSLFFFARRVRWANC